MLSPLFKVLGAFLMFSHHKQWPEIYSGLGKTQISFVMHSKPRETN